MKRLLFTMTMISALLVSGLSVCADSILLADQAAKQSFPDLTAEKSRDYTSSASSNATSESATTEYQAAVWPFGKKDDGATEDKEFKPKSTRKAFFLSFLMPGLGEAYVGSKTSLLFLGLEAASWFVYMKYTGEGNDLEDDFQDFADAHWHYDTTTASDGSDLDFNYFEWAKAQLRQVNISDDIESSQYSELNSRLEDATKKSQSSISGYSVHNLPSTKTQQYYEMIGKYPQFVYGWEDIDNPEANPTFRNNDDSVNYYVPISSVKSAMRMEYEDMRDKSNDKLKLGQRGIHIMILNRVISAVHAARLAYHHNKRVDSELSSIEIDIVEKRIIDNKVPMIRLTKKF